MDSKRPNRTLNWGNSLVLLGLVDDFGCCRKSLWWRWRELNPRPRSAAWRVVHRLVPLWMTSTGMRADDPDRGLVPGFQPPSGDVAMAYSVPSFGRPKPPVGRFYEPATRRSRGLARSAIKRRGPVRSYRWQFCFDRLDKGANRPTPACASHPCKQPVETSHPQGACISPGSSNPGMDAKYGLEPRQAQGASAQATLTMRGNRMLFSR